MSVYYRADYARRIFLFAFVMGVGAGMGILSVVLSVAKLGWMQ